jgi:hypothetical protein
LNQVEPKQTAHHDQQSSKSSVLTLFCFHSYNDPFWFVPWTSILNIWNGIVQSSALSGIHVMTILTCICTNLYRTNHQSPTVKHFCASTVRQLRRQTYHPPF